VRDILRFSWIPARAGLAFSLSRDYAQTGGMPNPVFTAMPGSTCGYSGAFGEIVLDHPRDSGDPLILSLNARYFSETCQPQS
jgi:hypothetical protein